MKNNQMKMYHNVGYIFFILLTFVLIGFFKTYFNLYPNFNANITNIIHFHFFVVMIWVLLLIVQPLLIRYKKFKIHSIIGKTTFVLAPLIILSLILLMYKQYHDLKMQTWSTYDLLCYFYYQGIHTICFTVFYSLAIFYRPNIYLHSTFMIATGIVFIKPSLTRLLIFGVGIFWTLAEVLTILFIDVLLITTILYVMKKGQNYKPYLLIFSMLLFYHIPALIKFFKMYQISGWH